MSDDIQWLREVPNGKWGRLAEALRTGLPVPDGFVAVSRTPESAIRAAYDEIKIREHTYYVAVRASGHALLDVIGPDRLIHTAHRLWAEAAEDPLLIETMVNAAWCGKAAWEGRHLRLRASEGLMCLDPDMYLYNPSTKKCTRRVLHQRPRKVFRGVDGSTRTMELGGERRPLELKYIEAVSDLATRAAADITWALDDRGVWLIGFGNG